jgi:murein DD-endopeptidase MepM/ murein hydrolase activator NlpD
MRMCDGPRRTPEPYGPDAFKAERLGLGTLETGRRLLKSPPKPEWIAAVRGQTRPTLLWPVEDGRFGRGFGYVRKERKSLRHNGVDVGASVGQLVRSLNDGIVAYSDNQISGFGNTVTVVHKDGSVSFYCHQRANYVFAGQQVKRGQVVGEVGTTGISRGPHLHFQWHVNGAARDPMKRMVGQPARRRGDELALLAPLM